MTRITNTEQVLLILRAHLERARNAERKGGADAKAVKQARTKPLERMRALCDAGVDDRQMERALIAAILTEEFGADLANEARFQQVIEDVTDLLRRDERGQSLLDEAMSQLRP